MLDTLKKVTKEEGLKVKQRTLFRQAGMYETCVILSCYYGKLSYAKWQVKLDDKKW